MELGMGIAVLGVGGRAKGAGRHRAGMGMVLLSSAEQMLAIEFLLLNFFSKSTTKNSNIVPPTP